jgi:hypothetical protein
LVDRAQRARAPRVVILNDSTYLDVRCIVRTRLGDQQSRSPTPTVVDIVASATGAHMATWQAINDKNQLWC